MLLKIKYHYLPGIVCTWFLLIFLIGFIVSLYYQQIFFYFPFISDTGSTPPASCIFGQMLNIGALMFSFVIFIRYRQLKMLIQAGEEAITHKWNVIGVWCGFVSCLGMSIVANFQETNSLLVHAFGAALAFGIGSFYLIIQTAFSYKLRELFRSYPEYKIGPGLLYTRIVLTALYCLFYGIASPCAAGAFLQFKGKSIPLWTKDDGGYDLKVIAAGFEWLLAITYIIVMATTTKELKLLQYEEENFKQKYATCKCKAIEATVTNLTA